MNEKGLLAAAIIAGIIMSAIALVSPTLFWMICLAIAGAVLLGLI
jgi:hypothetical protein